MAFNETLAERIRQPLFRKKGITEKKRDGGIPESESPARSPHYSLGRRSSKRKGGLSDSATAIMGTILVQVTKPAGPP